MYYCGTNSGAGAKKVVIAGSQTQIAFNNTKHFGAAGDCGVATATKTTVSGKRGYRFNLQHKASYLCFLPYMAIKAQRANFKIRRIEITSNNNISGTYGLTQAGLSYKSHNFGANKICDIPVNLGVMHYNGRNYYMWDARKNYWYGHEWDASVAWQPIVNDKTNGGYPKSKADASRWYHEGSGSFEASVNPLFKQLPNANEIGWYVLRGDAHWDNSTQWKAFGTTYTSGIWLKRLSVIAQENGKKPAALKLKDPKGNDLRASSYHYRISPKNGKPADSVIGDYFFLPALGYYLNGKLSYLGSYGLYWSSSAYPSHRSYAYRLSFYSGTVYLDYGYRADGIVAQPFE